MIRASSRLGGLLLLILLAGAVRAATAPAQDEASLSGLLDRATAYVAGYAKALTSVVSEERYEQAVMRLVPRGAAPAEKELLHRTLVSDYLLVQVPGTSEWVPFRDVYSVDGTPVRDRNDRLVQLFLKPSPTAVARALQIREESSRYNIGRVTRDINVPTFALQILGADLRGRFDFTEQGTDRVGDLDTVVVAYDETSAPTIIRGRGNANVPASGRFWIQPGTGTVVRSLLQTRPAGMRTRIEVTFSYEPRLGILVPSEMDERHELAEETVDGRSTYSNFRRFRVDTAIEIK